MPPEWLSAESAGGRQRGLDESPELSHYIRNGYS
jgi:hypothetical protein